MIDEDDIVVVRDGALGGIHTMSSLSSTLTQ